MKKLLIIFAALALTTSAFGQITGTAHDFSAETWNSSEGDQICIVCHTPHNAQDTPDAPLWNHLTTVQAFTPYEGPGTLNATVGDPSGVSLLCLSCHDGVTALDSFGGTTGSIALTGTGNLGIDLRNDHPISFTYDTALATADGELADPSAVVSGLGGTISEDMLFSDQMECASCHDVHGATGMSSLLLMDNAGSALCLKCHLK